MKTLGIVGGIGPESTIEYYRFILDRCRARTADGSAPHIIIDSIDVNRGIAMLDANDLAALSDYISGSVERLIRAGADVALIAANTPHIVFDDVQRRSRIPMISLVQAACDRAAALGLRRLGLLGTGFTMRGRFYPEVFARAGLELITPNEDEKALIHRAYIGELLKNEFRPETRAAIASIIERMRRDDGIASVLLAGTELPLLLRGAQPEGITFLDTTMIHVDAAVDAICG
ncbi:MAG TPA: amino acid racemase [Chthoniobacterales bacterium]|nr:amino acid racemase [Chthoniobacterales bacterium]